jgi:rhamnose transport system ATP-binding protein
VTATVAEPGSARLLLDAVGVSKAFDGVQALDSVSFNLREGEVHALVGENGAGKSTLIRIITGAISRDDGTLKLNGEVVTSNSPRVAKSLGVAVIYQQPALFSELTVAENIALGLDRLRAWQPIDWKSRRRRASDLLQKVGARIDPDAYAGELTMPEQQLVEIARALGAEARVLVMDEPTASLSEGETQNLFRVIRELRAGGVGIIYISHRLAELAEIADRVTVLRDGRAIATREMSEVDRQELIRLMVGRELSAVFPKKEVELGDTVLELRGLSSRAAGIRDVSLSVRAGEILGLAGLVGAGRTELAMTLFGLSHSDSGTILLRGEQVRITSPSEAINLGIAYVPEDRRHHGVVPEMDVAANTTLGALPRCSRLGFLDFDEECRIARDYVDRLGVKTRSLYQPVSTLSGGNQQKVALGRWLATKPSVLILDEPTQGIDIGAKAEIHALMGELAAQGLAIIMISSELPEILGLSDRIAVMRSGTIAGTLERSEASQSNILALALAHESSGSAGAGDSHS